MRRDPGTAVHAGDGPARANADAFIARPNPIITGWVAHYRIGVSKHAFGNAGRPPVEADREMGQIVPPEQAKALDHHPVLLPCSSLPSGLA